MSNKQVVLVTGSSKGIGASIAKKFKDSNWVVIQNSRNKISGESLIGDSSIIADVTKSDEVTSLVKQIRDTYGHLDALVCNVGSGKNIDSSDPEVRWKHFIKMNLLSASNIIEQALPLLDHSSVTVISSLPPNITTVPGA